MPANRLKSSYQRNMMAGLSISCLTILVPSLFLHFLYRDEEMVKIHLANIVNSDIPIRDNHESDPQNKGKFREYLPDENGSSMGIIIGRRIKLVSPSLPASNPNDFIYRSPEIKGPPIPGDIDCLESFRTVEAGANIKAGTGDEYPINPPVESISSERQYDIVAKKNPQIKPKKPNSEVFVEFPGRIPNLPYIYPGEEVKVLLRLVIDDDGDIMEIETLYEDPVGRNFASVIKGALRTDAYIEPSIRDGIPVGSTFLFTWQHKNGDGRSIVRSTDNVIVSVKSRE